MSNRTMSTTMVTSSSSSSSAETIEGNEYLLTEILVHLPAKSLLRLKCVSKRWDSLISSPYFRGRHMLLHGGGAATAKVSGMILHPDLCSNPEKFKLFSFKNGRSRHSPSPFNSIAKNHNPNGIYIRQSCNGLILGTITFHRYKSSPESHFVMNPTTKDFTLIPHPGPSIYQVVRLGLAFDPLLSSSYTVICVWRSSTSNYTYNYRFMVYSSETRAWKACESSSVVPTDTRIGKGVYFNGAVHWFCWRQRVSLCFDVREECINDNMPPLPTRQHHYHAAPSCGHLNLVGIGGSVMNVFRLERDYSKWVPIHTVDIQLTQLPTAFPDIFYHSSSIGQTEMSPQYDVLCLMQDDREDSEDGDMSFLLELPSKIIALRFKDNTFYQVFDLAGVRRRAICPGLGRYTASAYVASLACV